MDYPIVSVRYSHTHSVFQKLVCFLFGCTVCNFWSFCTLAENFSLAEMYSCKFFCFMKSRCETKGTILYYLSICLIKIKLFLEEVFEMTSIIHGVPCTVCTASCCHCQRAFWVFTCVVYTRLLECTIIKSIEFRASVTHLCNGEIL
jgi:hypothetical protein